MMPYSHRMTAIQNYLKPYIMLLSITPYFLFIFAKQEISWLTARTPTTSKSEVEVLVGQLVCVADLPSRRRLRSASSHQLLVPSFRLTTVGRRTFPVAASLVWNSLPSDIQASSSVSDFRQRLKTFLFRQSLPDIVLWSHYALVVYAKNFWLTLTSSTNCYSAQKVWNWFSTQSPFRYSGFKMKQHIWNKTHLLSIDDWSKSSQLRPHNFRSTWLKVRAEINWLITLPQLGIVRLGCGYEPCDKPRTTDRINSLKWKCSTVSPYQVNIIVKNLAVYNAFYGHLPTRGSKTANMTKDDITCAAHHLNVTVLRSNIIFCHICYFRSACWRMSSLKGIVNY